MDEQPKTHEKSGQEAGRRLRGRWEAEGRWMGRASEGHKLEGHTSARDVLTNLTYPTELDLAFLALLTCVRGY